MLYSVRLILHPYREKSGLLLTLDGCADAVFGVAGGGNGFPGFCALDHSCGGKMVHGKIRNGLRAVYERSKALYLGNGKCREP